MSNATVDKSLFSAHCSHETPFFCHYTPKGQDFHAHMDYYEFCIIVGGSYKHTYGKTQTVYNSGTLLFFRPGEVHSLIENSPNSYHYSLIVKESYFRDFCSKHNQKASEILSTPFVEKKLPGFQLVYLSQLASSVSYTISEELIPVMQHLISTLIFACFESLPNTLAKSSRIYAVDLFQRLNNYESLDMNVTSMYKEFPLSKSELTRDFKELTGYTLVEYRNIKRMEYAAQLLTETDYSVTDIAGILNLSSAGYLSKQFKKQYGVTPKQYQSMYLSKSRLETKSKSNNKPKRHNKKGLLPK